MDESSRNIVKFIAAGTGAILLLMAAYYYSRAPEPAPTPVAATEKAKPPEETKSGEIEPLLEQADEEEVEEPESEDIAPIDGSPSVPAQDDE